MSDRPPEQDSMPTRLPGPDPAPPLDSDSVPEEIGPYEVLEEIGRGGMGVVFKAFHRELKRTVALKVLRAGEDASDEAVVRFRREAEAVAKLGHHPNIVPVYDVGAVGRLHYIAMHLVEGPSLEALLDEEKISPRRGAAIARQVADALAHAHAHGVLHRDVKPANILLAPSGEETRNSKSQIPNLDHEPETRNPKPETSHWVPMLTDFGLARDVGCDARVTASGTVLGTPNYMAPEQADGRLDAVDERSDVYSLGATLYELLTLHPPFEGQGVIEILHKVVRDDPVPPRARNPKVGRDLETVCLKCLEKDPGRRYPTAAALAADLGRALEGEAIEARPVGTLGRLLRRARRNRLLTAALAVSLLLAAAAAVGAPVAARRWRAQRTVLEASRETEAAGRRDAETDRDAALQALQKNRSVSRLLLGAQGKLGEVHRALKQAHYDSRLADGDRAAAWQRLRPRVRAALAELSGDGAARAAAQALEGWFALLGEDEAAARELFSSARRTDPEVAWGFLFEAMEALTDYLLLQPMPEVTFSSGRVQVGEVPGETPAMEAARERFEALAEPGARASVWGETALDMRRVLAAFMGIRGRDLEAAARALGEALSAPEMSWVEEELRLARAKVLYLLGRFDEGAADLEAVIERIPGDGRTWFYLGNFRAARWHLGGRAAGFEGAREAFDAALERDPDHAYALNARGVLWMHAADREGKAGRDPRDRFRRAFADFAACRNAKPGYAGVLRNEASAQTMAATWSVEHGADPEEFFAGAEEAFAALLRSDPRDALAWSGSGILLRWRAEHRARRGGDPRDLFREALARYDRALALRPDVPSALHNRGLARRSLGEWESRNGIDPRETLSLALADFDRGLEIEAGRAAARFQRAAVTSLLAEWEARAGGDPRPLLARVQEDLAVVLKEDPASSQAWTARGTAFGRLGAWLSERGEDPLEALDRALEAFEAVALLGPPNALDLNNRGNARRLRGEARAARGLDPTEDFEGALDDFAEALRANPAYEHPMRNAGACALQLGLWKARCGEDPAPWFERALEAFGKAQEREPGRWQTHQNRGLLLDWLGRFEESLGEFEKARALLGDTGGSIAVTIERARVKARGGEWAALASRAAFLTLVGRERDALDLFRRAVQAAGKAGEPKDPRAASYLAFVHYDTARACNALLAREPGTEETDAWMRAGLEALRQCWALGLRDAGGFRADEALAALRTFPDFEALMAELQGEKR